jgi:dihydroxyacid dehydratase/phosphogluconate dehydratase
MSARYLSAITSAGGIDMVYSANTMSSALEVLGLSLPYSSSTPATYAGALFRLNPELRFT